MSVKLSDIIWTVICFGLFTLVLNELLLKPVLRFMDSRKARIDGVNAKALEAEGLAEKARQKRLLEREQAALLRAKERETALEKARAESARELEALSKELSEKASLLSREMEGLEAETRERLEASVGRAAEAFAQRLSGGTE